MKKSEGLSIGVDIGGTFTDCAIVQANGTTFIGKVLTTPDDPSIGFFRSIEAAGARAGLSESELYARAERIAHGTTVGINALVTRQGASVALLATKGHGDALRIMDNTGRVTGASIEEMLDFSISTSPEQFVERSLVLEIVERVDFEGEVVVPLDEVQLVHSIDRLIERSIDAVAVSYLWSHVNHEHELRTREILEDRAPDLFVSLSHEVAPRIGEYPRAATAVMNAYIGPLMRRYVDGIIDGARERGLRGDVLWSTCEGGLTDSDTVRAYPIVTLQSGPVAGVLGCAAIGDTMGFRNVITSDMGGTSLDASVVEDGHSIRTDDAVVERHQLHLRKVDVESIGAGGGSIAWYEDLTATIKVGPGSAGAVPGPVCYGRGGTEPTVTDADLVLRILDHERGLAGGLKLDLPAAEAALGQLGEKLGIDAVHAAAGVVEIIDSRMEDLLRRVTLQKGHDPREFVLWAFGGAAGMHAGLYGRGLGVQRVIVPMNDLASVWSAYGMAVSQITRTFSAPLFLHTPLDPAALAGGFDELEGRAHEYARHVHGARVKPDIRRTAEMKYAMQWYSVEFDISPGPIDERAIPGIIDSFEDAYEKRYGPDSGYREAGMTMTAIRVTLRLPWERPALRRIEQKPKRMSPGRSRTIYWSDSKEFVETPIYEGIDLTPKDRFDGPAIVEYPETTVVVRPDQILDVDPFGNLVIELANGRRG